MSKTSSNNRINTADLQRAFNLQLAFDPDRVLYSFAFFPLPPALSPGAEVAASLACLIVSFSIEEVSLSGATAVAVAVAAADDDGVFVFARPAVTATGGVGSDGTPLPPLPTPVAVIAAAVVMVEFWFERQMPATVRGVVFSEVLQQRGESTHLLSAALRGWSRSGERARRSRGELGSAVFALGNPFLVGGVAAVPTIVPATIPGTVTGRPPMPTPTPAAGSPPGLYDCVVLDAPSGWTTGNASGLEDRVGEAGNGDGLGVRANGDSGI